MQKKKIKEKTKTARHKVGDIGYANEDLRKLSLSMIHDVVVHQKTCYKKCDKDLLQLSTLSLCTAPVFTAGWKVAAAAPIGCAAAAVILLKMNIIKLE